MGNPWAPSDPSSSTGGAAPEQQQVPGQPSAPPPAAPQPDPAGVARSSRAAAWSAAALLGSVLLMSAPYPAMLVAPAAALAGMVLAIVAVVRASRARARGATVALPVVLILASLAWVGISSQTFLYVDATREYARCESAALTQQARRTCATQLETDMRDRLTSLLGGFAPRTSSTP